MTDVAWSGSESQWLQERLVTIHVLCACVTESHGFSNSCDIFPLSVWSTVLSVTSPVFMFVLRSYHVLFSSTMCFLVYILSCVFCYDLSLVSTLSCHWFIFLLCHCCTHLFPVLALILSWLVCVLKPFCVFVSLWSLVHVNMHFCTLFHGPIALPCSRFICSFVSYVTSWFWPLCLCWWL